MLTPKIILRVEFLPNFEVKFSLVRLHPYFNNYKHGPKIYRIPNNDYIVWESGSFAISEGVVTIPDSKCTSINECYIKFISEKRRYMVLNELKDALLDWSGSQYWTNSGIFLKTPEIRYRKNLWVLY